MSAIEKPVGAPPQETEEGTSVRAVSTAVGNVNPKAKVSIDASDGQPAVAGAHEAVKKAKSRSRVRERIEGPEEEKLPEQEKRSRVGTTGAVAELPRAVPRPLVVDVSDCVGIDRPQRAGERKAVANPDKDPTDFVTEKPILPKTGTIAESKVVSVPVESGPSTGKKFCALISESFEEEIKAKGHVAANLLELKALIDASKVLSDEQKRERKARISEQYEVYANNMEAIALSVARDMERTTAARRRRTRRVVSAVAGAATAGFVSLNSMQYAFSLLMHSATLQNIFIPGLRMFAGAEALPAAPFLAAIITVSSGLVAAAGTDTVQAAVQKVRDRLFRR